MPHPPDQETKGHAEITIKRHLISHQNHARVITKKKELISIMKKVQKKTYNTGYSLVVTDPTTNPALYGLCSGERTGPSAFHRVWSYVEELGA